MLGLSERLFCISRNYSFDNGVSGYTYCRRLCDLLAFFFKQCIFDPNRASLLISAPSIKAKY